MPTRPEVGFAATGAVRRRCRCGHLPPDHMAVAPIGTSGNFRLDPSASCAICGEAACRRYAPE